MSKTNPAAAAQAIVDDMCSKFKAAAASEAEEIIMRAENRAEEQYNDAVTSVTEKLETEFNRQKAEIERNLQIRGAQIKNNVKLEVLKSQTEAIHEALKETIAALNKYSESPEYPELLKNLIAEGLDRLCETRVRIMVRKADYQIAQKVLADAVKIAQDRHPGLSIKVKLDDSRFLPGAPSCAGGVVLMAQKGRIRVSNVLNDRLRLAYDGMLPQIRKLILGDATQTV